VAGRWAWRAFANSLGVAPVTEIPVLALALGLLALGGGIEIAQGLMGLGRQADWHVLAPMSIAACAAMPLGVWLLASVDKNTIVTVVSAVIVAFVVLMWTGWKYTGRRSAAAGVVVGAVSGAMMATTSIGGPPVLLYLLSGNDPPLVNRANIVTYYFLTQFLLIVIVLATGVAGFEALARAVVLFPVMVLGAWAGGRLFHGLASERLYRNVALAILFVTGLFGLLRNWLFA